MPIADRPPRLRANASLTMQTGALVRVSRASNARPATIGRSSVEKYEGLTA
jgi:hypothetical protein